MSWDTSIIHADLDAFYASVESIRDPSLIGKPVIVGGTSNRGVVTSASYEARRFGVTSAMPTSRARRLCPNGIFIQPDFDAYTEYSQKVLEVFEAFSPAVEPLSLDEAFLDACGAARLWADPAGLGNALRDAVRDVTGLVVSVGIASNKFLAKLASTQAKPNGLLVVDPSRVREFLDPLPVGSLWGVGEQTKAILERLGLRKIGDVASVPRSTLQRALGSLGSHVSALASGHDDRPVVPHAPRKSVGAEQTFQYDLADDLHILRAILALSDRVASRLRASGMSGMTVTLKMRYSNFTTITRSKTVGGEIDGITSIYRVARDLLERDAARKRMRLLGVSISNLRRWPASEQLSLDPATPWSDAERALDGVRRRFGDESLKFGTLVGAERNGPRI